MSDVQWSTTVAIILAPPGREIEFDIDVSDAVFKGGKAYVSIAGTAGPSLAGSHEVDAGSGIWFGTTYLDCEEGTAVGFVRVSSVVSASHLKCLLVAIDDGMHRDPTATRWSDTLIRDTRSTTPFLMWPDRIITKTITERTYAHRYAPLYTPMGDNQ